MQDLLVSGKSCRLSRNFLINGSSVGWGDLQAELGGLLPEELDLVLAISSLVVFRTFVHVLLAELCWTKT
jgi:hypothetical protein